MTGAMNLGNTDIAVILPFAFCLNKLLEAFI
jgi:hypothetical protein